LFKREAIMIAVSQMLQKVREQKPVVHHITNWVTIYDCANIVKVFGASPVMAHAREEAADMADIASALVLNIGTLRPDLVSSMKIAAGAANKKGVPVVLDVCGAGATQFRDDTCFELLSAVKIDVVKGNASEIAKIAGENVKTKGVDSTQVDKDLVYMARKLAACRECTVVVTGKEDIVTNGSKTYIIRNGDNMMAHVVGTGCMAASVIGTFCAVDKDYALASASGLVCYEVAAELAAGVSKGPGTFKDNMFDSVFNLDGAVVDKMAKVQVQM
jgi:hydroxyethylthiazole kinase